MVRNITTKDLTDAVPRQGSDQDSNDAAHHQCPRNVLNNSRNLDCFSSTLTPLVLTFCTGDCFVNTNSCRLNSEVFEKAAIQSARVFSVCVFERNPSQGTSSSLKESQHPALRMMECIQLLSPNNTPQIDRPDYTLASEGVRAPERKLSVPPLNIFKIPLRISPISNGLYRALSSDCPLAYCFT